jgi:uncharacterized protein
LPPSSSFVAWWEADIQIASTFIAGILFGVGLVVSGLANPAKVLSFLDVAGAWDPSLIFTMNSAVAITGIGYRLVFARRNPIFADGFHMRSPGRIDGRLLAGATLFGIGWGLVGYCPGPAITAISLGNRSTFIFVAAMLAGMTLGRLLPSPASRSGAATS